jgi:preprotein translocase subunit SecD
MFNLLKIKVSAIAIICLFIIMVTLANFINLGKLSDKKIKFGVDLKSGKQVLLQLDLKNYLRNKLLETTDDLKTTFKEKKIRAIPKLQENAQNQEAMPFIQVTFRDANLNAVQQQLENLDNNLTIKIEKDVINIEINKGTLKGLKKELMQKSLKTLEKRISEQEKNNFVFYKKDTDKILVKTSSEENIQKIKESTNRAGILTFNFISLDTNMLSARNLKRIKAFNSDYRYLVEKKSELTGDLLIDAYNSYYKGSPVIIFQFNHEGTQKFSEITRNNIGKFLAIVLDNEVIMAPKINSVISNGSGMISGNFTEEEAIQMAKILKSGALPAPIIILKEENYESILNSKLIKNIIRTCITLAIVFVLFFFTMYKKLGLFANISFFMNICLIITLLSLCNIKLSYLGVMAFAISIIISLLLHILIFEKVRKFRQKGNSILNSVEKAFDPSFKMFLGLITLLVLACVLYLFGNSLMKNFALIFILGLLSSLFSGFFFAKTLITLGFDKFRLKEIKF